MQYDWYFFDFDGTIADTSSGIVRCFQNALAEAGITPMSDEAIKGVVGPPLPVMISKLCPDIDTQAAAIIFHRYRRDYATIGVAGMNMYTGITEIFDHLKSRGKKMAVVSSKPEKYLVEICEKNELCHYFEEIRGVDLSQTPASKGEILKGILDRYKIKREKAVLVGDTVSDVKAARSNGVDSIGVGYGFGSFDSEPTQPNYYCRTIDDLKALLTDEKV